MDACVEENLSDIKIKWDKRKSICVVLCSNGYPDIYKKDIKINNFEKLIINKNNFVFHAGTKIKENEIIAVGGRVLNFVSLSDDFSKARINIHNNLKKLNWKKGFYRKDIAFRVID